MYKNANIILATKHKKEEAIRDVVEQALHARIIVPEDFDTDQLGTFTGEVPRVGTPYETVVKKAKLAAQHYHYDYAIANEGSFGPHPSLFFMPADTEIIAFVDMKNDIIVTEFEMTSNTNYGHLDLVAGQTYHDFLNKIQFGTHGVIIRSLDDKSILAKGVVQMDELNMILTSSFQKYQNIRLETDMRAMMNPTRMSVINKLAYKLVERLQKLCDRCNVPGFGKLSVEGKLACRSCGTETNLYQFRVLSCIKCDYQESHPRQDGLELADPTYCPYCNP